MNNHNIQIIDGVPVDWSKFKSNAKGIGNIDKSRNAYVELCKMIHKNGHTLESDYTGASANITVDTKCGHSLVEIQATYYKTKIKEGRTICPECENKEKMEKFYSTIPAEEPKYNKEVYTIGFYNDKVDDIVKLSNCNRVFNDIVSLKYHIRDNDVVMLASELSLYGADKKEIQRLKEDYNIDFRVCGRESEDKETAGKRLKRLLVVNEYILNNEDMVKKLLKLA